MNILKSIWRRRATKPVEKTAEGAESIQLSTPAYYEVWGGLESANKALWVALWLCITVTILSLGLLRAQMAHPPIVIRVDSDGKAQALPGAYAQPQVSEVEVTNFLTLFERFFTELNSYTYESDIKLAFDMMTQDFQKKATDTFNRDGTLQNLKANKTKTTLHLTEMKVARDTSQVFEVHVKGYREIGSYKPDGVQSEVVFDDDVILRKVPRSAQAPYGLLVEDFNESVFKR